MRYRNGKGYVSHPLSTNLLLCYLYTATVADDPFVADSLVLSAMALIILRRAEDSLAEKSVSLRFVGTVVDSLRL